MLNLSDETKGKLLSDNGSAIELTILVNPEPLSEISPTLPDNFPDSLIPKEKCEIQMASLINCMLKKKFDNVPCENFQFEYYECKKFRDSVLFSNLHHWECKEFNKMSSFERKMHMEALLLKKAKLLDTYENVQSLSKNIILKKRIDSDIQQITWRMNYLPKCLI